MLGDAAFQTKATTGGGIVTGCMAAETCAETLLNTLKNPKALSEYEKNLKYLNRELHLHWKIRKYLNSLSEESMNKLVEKLKKAGVESFLEKHGNMDMPTLFVGKFLRQPKVWGLMSDAMRIITG